MKRLVLTLGVVAACGAPMQSVRITNATDRPIEELYLYPLGAAAHGPSRGPLAPGASLTLEHAPGNLELYAVSARVQLEEHTRERRAASTALELAHALEVVLYDVGAKPAALARGAIGVVFEKAP